MATCLKGAMATVSLYPSLSSPSRRAKNRCAPINARSSATTPNMPFNPNDSFLRMLSSTAANSPEKLYDRPVNPDSLPFVDLFYDSDAPRMSSPSQVEKSPSYSPPRTRTPPPDLPSLLFHNRIVYIGLPLVPVVTELIVAELMYLQYSDSKQPIQMYVNSSGTATDDGERVAMESEGFAIYDALQMLENEIRTLALGCAIGMACLLVAAGTKGKRCMMPHAHLAIKQPRLPSSGLVPANEVVIRAKEAIYNRDLMIKLFAKHTGNSEEVVANELKEQFSMGPVDAKRFGIIDKVLWKGQEEMMKKKLPPSEWVKIDEENKGIRI